MKAQHITLPIHNFGCAGSEAYTVERVLQRAPGVQTVYVNPATEMAYVQYDPARSDPQQLLSALEHAGYGAPPRCASATALLSQDSGTHQLRLSSAAYATTRSRNDHLLKKRYSMALGQTQQSSAAWRYGGLALTVGLLLLVLFALRGAFGFQATTPTAPAQPVTQVNQAGEVTIKATWQGFAAAPVFTVVLDTHVVDLDSYDLAQLAVLRTDQGLEAQPLRWDAPKGGHHRQGTLTFPTTVEQRPLVGPDTRTVELIIRDVAGVPERSLQWTR